MDIQSLNLGTRREKRMRIVADVAIIDTGLFTAHTAFSNTQVQGISFCYNEKGEIEEREDYYDTVGHGTAVAGLITDQVDNVKLFICKVTDKDSFIPENILLAALFYLEENVDCSIINMSIGYTRTQYHRELYQQIKRMEKKGIIFVSAFDNQGAISYPAAYDCVIGVDSNDKCRHSCDMIYVGGEAVTVFAKGSMLRVPSLMGSYIVVRGTSFATAIVTKQVLMYYRQKNREAWCLKTVKNYLKSKSKQCHEMQIKSPSDKFSFHITNAAVFPYGKEALNLALYAEQLTFRIVDFYDYRLFGKVGKVIKKEFSRDYVPRYYIKNMDDIDWESIDTLILCHIDKFINQLNMENYIKEIIECSLCAGKQIFSFDNILRFLPEDMQISHPNVYWPEITVDSLPKHQFGKLHCLSIPVLGVFGTSSSQGKFAVQMNLRQKLIKMGYRVAQVGTEPYSELMGFDAVFPMGYNSSVFLNGYESVYMINHILHQLELKNPDIIIAGAQSGTIPYCQVNLRSMTQSTVEFLFGIEPDAVVLCVNPYDPLEYISRTILYIQSAVDTKVIALCLFPYTMQGEEFVSISAKRKMKENEIQNTLHILKEQFQIPVYNILGEDFDDLIQCVIDFF